MILQNIKLKNELNALAKNHPKVADIFVFGSVVRGKPNPSDIDILILFKDKVDKNVEYLLRKELEKHAKNISIISKTEKTVLDIAFDARESVLFEAKSLLTEKNIAQQYGFSSFGMFKYNFGKWSKLQKIKFYYALNGRGKMGIAEKMHAIKLSDSVILVPLEYIEEFRSFLENWKINYIYIPLIIPTRLGRKSILE